MSSSVTNSAIFLTDSPKEIKHKINKHALSGGQDTLAEQRRLGANLEVDVSCHYLTFFLEDDQELELFLYKYSVGELLSGDIKKKLVEVLTELILAHQEERSKVTDFMIDEFMSVRALSF